MNFVNEYHLKMHCRGPEKSTGYFSQSTYLTKETGIITINKTQSRSIIESNRMSSSSSKFDISWDFFSQYVVKHPFQVYKADVHPLSRHFFTVYSKFIKSSSFYMKKVLLFMERIVFFAPLLPDILLACNLQSICKCCRQKH